VTARDDLPGDLAEAVALGGEMGRRFAEYDWANHPLGPLSGWPPEWRAMVAVALTSRFPIVLWLDPEQLYLVYNDAYLSVLGDRHPGALAEPGGRVWWDIWDSIGPMLSGVIASGQATWSVDLLLALVTAGRAQERYFTFTYSPIIGGTGTVNGIFCAVTETTERVLGERRLNLLNTAASALMETRTVGDVVEAVARMCADPVPDLPFLAFYGRDAAVGTVGASRLMAATPAVAGLLPRTLDALVTEYDSSGFVVNDLPSRLPKLSTVLAHCPERALVLPVGGGGDEPARGGVVIGLNPRRPFDDQYRAFCRLLIDQVSSAFATVGSYERERRRADSLAELDQAKTAFLANVSHEFRTPLTLLLGPVEDAMSAARDDSAQLARLAVVHRNAGRLLRLVNSLLDFSRTEAGRATADRVRVDVGALTERIASSFTELCTRAGLDLVVRCAAATVDVDVRMWETILLNLLSNAVKYTLAGAITVTVEAGDGTVVVRVADTGIGIAKDDLPHLFDRFYRASNPRGRSVEGSGIGLSLVRSLVDLQGGTIDLTSELDAGTAVTITLPAAADDATVAVSPDLGDGNPYVDEAMQWLDTFGGEAAPRGDRSVVLVADDNADMRRHLHHVLSARWDTLVFADGEAALDGARRHHPDVVITDVMMPNLDGFGFVEALRADPELARIPVLMLSARAGVEAAGEGFAHGADDYLPKPFSSEDLITRVAARLSAAGRERTARVRDEAAQRHLTDVAEFGAALGKAGSTDDLLDVLLSSEHGSRGATAVALGRLEDSRIRITYAGDIPTELRDRYYLVSVDASIPLAEVLRTGTPMVIPDTEPAAPRFEWVARDFQDTVRAAVIHPLRDGLGRVTGAVALCWPRPRAFSPTELDTIAETAAATSVAVTRIWAAEREHRIAVGFQEHLLDLDRRSAAAVVAAVYEPAAEAMRVGGDWYLTMPLADPARLGVSVGDVVGHGLRAATVMSKLRAATSTSTITDAEPTAVLDVLQQSAANTPGAASSTVAYAVVDSRAHTLEYACAGHPYPLLVLSDGTTRYLGDGRRPALGAFRTANGPLGHAEFPPGALLLLYTDGLVERRGESLDAGFARLAEAVSASAGLPTGEVCDEVLRRMRPAGGYTDDVVLVAVRCPGVDENGFFAVVPAQVDQIPALRHAVRDWLAPLDLDRDTTHDVLLTTCEALSNAIEHGSDPDLGPTVCVEGFADEHQIAITVSDTGAWTNDSSASRRDAVRGRGLTLINGLADTVHTTRTNRGTRVTMTHRRPEAGVRS
jgi:signal transduction histidine kinase/FixJ family two-component response regulator